MNKAVFFAAGILFLCIMFFTGVMVGEGELGFIQGALLYAVSGAAAIFCILVVDDPLA